MDTATIALTALAWALQLGGLAVILGVAGYAVLTGYRDLKARGADADANVAASIARRALVDAEVAAIAKQRADVAAWLDYPAGGPR